MIAGSGDASIGLLIAGSVMGLLMAGSVVMGLPRGPAGPGDLGETGDVGGEEELDVLFTLGIP